MCIRDRGMNPYQHFGFRQPWLEHYTVSYTHLDVYKRQIDKNMKKKELCEKAGISSSTIVKMGRQEPVSVELIGKICLALGCTANDVLEFLPDEDSVKA